MVKGGPREVDQIQSQMRDMSRNLILRFCCAKEINKNRQCLLMIKSVFLAKVQLLKSQGQKFELLQKLDSYVDKNIDMLVKNYMVQKKKNEKRKQQTYRQILLKKELEAKEEIRVKKVIKNKIMDVIEAKLT